MDHGEIVRAAADAYLGSRPAARLLAELDAALAHGPGAGVLHPVDPAADWADPRAATATAWVHTGSPATLTVAPAPAGTWLGVQVVDLFGRTVLVHGSADPVTGPLTWSLGRGPDGPGTDWVRVDAVALAARGTERRTGLELVGLDAPRSAPALPGPAPAGDLGALLGVLLGVARPAPGSAEDGWAWLLDADPGAVSRGALLGESLVRDAARRGGPSADPAILGAVRAADGLERLDPRTVLTTRLDTTGGETARGDRAYRLTLDADHLAHGRGGWTLSTHRLPDGRHEAAPHASASGWRPHPDLEALVQHTRPARVADTERWLRSPRGAFAVLLRLYQPTAEAIRGEWLPPVLRPVHPEVDP
ncbi:DUF1214 domain-containing protein [Cellulomonas denverensis]|uniref:DUF1214 domain-containing protein n=1 Tax=Cellulomonas denverensis TaxID=264297 RepID=UPI0035EC4383